MNKSELYSALIRFGTCYPMKLTGKTNNICETLDEKYKWIRYNPRKNIERVNDIFFFEFTFFFILFL